MTVALLRKDELPAPTEVAPPADVGAGEAVAAEVPQASPLANLLAANFKLPSAGAMFDAAWPPLAGIAGFVGLWAVLAPMVHTSLGALPGPGDVWSAFVGLMEEYGASRQMAAEAVATGQFYTGPPTFIDQIFTSLKTVAMGFILASLVAVPLGLVAGMSKRFNAAINPLVQVMRPISPLAWLPIVCR